MDRDKRNEERAERYRQLAVKARERAEGAYAGAKKIMDNIPMGQPILVGHHSERGHRADIKRIDSRMNKAIEEDKKASYFKEKAITAEKNTTIYSDDDRAVEKLQAKLAEKEKFRDKAKAANAALRKNDNAAMKALGFTDEQIAGLKTPDFAGRLGFPSYVLTNAGAEIRRLKLRIEQVTATQARPEQQIEVGAVEIRENAEFGSVEISFPGKPEQGVIDNLKSNGFRWARTSKVWYRKGRSDGLLELAKRLVDSSAKV